MDIASMLRELGLTGSAAALDLASGAACDVAGDELVTPASVMKVQVALAASDACATGRLNADEPRVLDPHLRTPGPVGISLMHDEVRMSIRDLTTLMLTISDNAATDYLIGLVGLEEVNAVTGRLGLTATRITSNLQDMLDATAVQLGFPDYRSLADHEPATDGPPTAGDIRSQLPHTTAFDLRTGTRTTAIESTRLLGAIWADTAAHPDACAAVRNAMARQLTRHRIASGYQAETAIAAKSGGLLGIVRNEVGVVTYPDGRRFAVAVFTRKPPGSTAEPTDIDNAIGQIARSLTDHLHHAH